MPSVINSLSGRLPEKAPRLDLMGTEAPGGGKVFFGVVLILGVFLGIYRMKIRVRRPAGSPQARGAPSRACPVGLLSHP